VLLAETRLLLASQAAEDSHLRDLLEDLELTLVRVVAVAAQEQSGQPSATERRTFEDGLDRKAILPRLRTELATGNLPLNL
jgi:hypothetical protein